MKKHKIFPMLSSALMLFAENVNAQLQWSVVTPIPTGDHLSSVAYGNGLYVAVGNAGTILTSSDGQTWIARTSGTTAAINSVTYGNGQYEAVNNTRYFISTDGITWSSHDFGSIGITRIGVYGVAYGNGQYVAVGSAYHDEYPGFRVYFFLIYTSPDGINWTSRMTTSFGFGFENALRAVIYGNGKYIAVGGMSILASTDGNNWVRCTTMVMTSFRSITYGNSQYVTVGGNGTILTSADGINWSSQISGTSPQLKSVTYGNGQYIAVGDSGIILNSSDGISWTLNSSGSGDTLNSVAVDTGGRFVAVGNNGTIVVSNGTSVINSSILKPAEPFSGLIVNVRNRRLSISLPPSMLGKDIDMTVHSASGRVVIRKMIAQAGENLTITAYGLAAGAYVLSVNDGIKKPEARFVMVR